MDNLSNIKEKSKELFKKNIQDNMISFLKNIDNDISYKLWLYKFNIEEYHFEFTIKNRTNSYYHELWNELIHYEDFILVY
tara:strand:- start:292 stop:531 length:240 start_codon:yes stop_codon:yes gene_type:complete